MKKAFVNFAVLFFALAPFVRAEDPYQIIPLPNPNAIYSLSEHLSEADAVIYVEKKESRKGVWENDAFTFYGFDKEGEIQVINESDEKQNWQSIQMNSLKGVNRMIQFGSVPSGGKLNFYYKTALEKPTKQNVYIYVLIKAGRKEVARFRVTCNQQGWQKQWISLGVLRLFNRVFPLTVEILGDKEHACSFQFYSEVYS